MTIYLTSSDPSEGLITTPTIDTFGNYILTFDSTNWNTPQSVTITGQDDALEDGAISYHIALTTSSTDTPYNNLAVANVGAVNIDNDSAGFTILSGGNLSTTETNGTASFQVVLNKAPTSDVTINLSSSNPLYGGTVSTGSTLTFTTANWSTPQNVTITGANNNIYGNISYTINIAVAPGSAPEYASLIYLPSESITNIDNDSYSTIYVTTNSDADDGGDVSSIAALYLHPGTDGISLREAIQAANASANGSSPDKIYFNLASGSRTITLNSALPDIISAVEIDGNNGSGSGTPSIELNGTNVSAEVGLHLFAGSDGSTIRGLVINRFGQEGIIVDSNNNIIAGCYIGTDVAGTTASANGWNGWYNAVWINGNNNTFGGTTAADRNVVSGNTHHGIWITGDDNFVKGNYLGVDKTGNIGLGNGCSGVGTDTMAERNSILNNVVSGNGLYSNQPWSNIEIRGTYTIIAGNFIGTNAAGNAAIGNSLGYGIDGICVYSTGSYTTIGGTTAAARNIISGNLRHGIYLNYSSYNTIQGNYIGLNAAGNAIIANGQHGIAVWGGSYNTIGGTTAAARNVVSGNLFCGIYISGVGAASSHPANYNTVQGNYIGTFADGTGSIATSGNARDGIGLRSGQPVTNNQIGGTADGAGNLIAYNAQSGVRLDYGGCTGNPILGNSIYGNGLYGIDLTNVNSLPPTMTGLGITANDLRDSDTAGGNNLQNYPVLATATMSGTQVRIGGTFNSTPNSTFRIEFFANASADSSGYGEGQRYLGFANVATNGSGNAAIDVMLTASVADGEYISATATNLTTNDTSEFAQSRIAHTAGINVTPISPLTTSEDGTTARISVALNAAPASDVTITISTSDSDEGRIVTSGGTVSTTQLTFTPANWSQAQLVTFIGVFDCSTDGNVPYTINIGSAVSSDAFYSGLNGAALISHQHRPRESASRADSACTAICERFSCILLGNRECNFHSRYRCRRQ